MEWEVIEWVGQRKRSPSNAIASHVDHVRRFVSYGFSVEAENAEKQTPLSVACAIGNVSVVRCLIEECKADASRATSNGVTPLLSACESGRIAVIHYLVSHPQTPVHSDENVINKYIKKAHNSQNLFFLHFLTSSEVNCVELVEVIKCNAIDVNAQGNCIFDGNGRSVLIDTVKKVELCLSHLKQHLLLKLANFICANTL